MLCVLNGYTANEPTEPVEAAVRRLEARWSDVTRRVVAGRESVTASNAVVQFGAELDSLMNTIGVYDKWASSDDVDVARDFVQLSQQLEQCRVRRLSYCASFQFARFLNTDHFWWSR